MYLCIVLSSSLPTYIHIYIYAYQILSIVYIHAPTDELPYHLCESMFKDFRTRSKVISNNQVTRDIPGSYKPSHALLQGRSHWKWTNKWNFKVDSDTFWDIFYSAQVLNRNIYIYICIKRTPAMWFTHLSVCLNMIGYWIVVFFGALDVRFTASRPWAWKDGRFTCTAKAFGSCTGRVSCRRCMDFFGPKSRINYYMWLLFFPLSLSLKDVLQLNIYILHNPMYILWKSFQKNQWEAAVLSTFIPVSGWKIWWPGAQIPRAPGVQEPCYRRTFVNLRCYHQMQMKNWIK